MNGTREQPVAFPASSRHRKEAALRPQPLTELPPLSLYVHIPWCLRKCPYCDFNSHAVTADVDEALLNTYAHALLADLEAVLPQIGRRHVVSIFIGGGTPSLLTPQQVQMLLSQLRARLNLLPGCEITLEANPGTFEQERFVGYHEAGVTRLSIGVQSFDDASLRAIGRVHTAAQALAAVREAASVFETFNLDLMYALPGQTLTALERDLRQALEFAPPHLSIYHLSVEPNTFFARRPPALPDEETAWDMLDAICQRTAAADLQRYEVSAFARAGHPCVHNINYWRFGDYLGIGAGAHSKISASDGIRRQVRLRDPARYMKGALAGHALAQDDAVPPQALAFEFMLNALRLRDGFPLRDFSARTGLPLSAISDRLDKAQRLGLLEQTPQRIVRPTARGFELLSDLQALFLDA